MIQHKECAFCSLMFPRNGTFSDLQWAEAKYCSRPCYFRAQKGRPVLSALFSRIKIDTVTSCWLWQGSVDSKGYGLTIHDGKKNQKVHRVVYALSVGKIPTDKLVLHRCDVRNCCNPFHLFTGTVQDNTDDMVLKGRGRWLQGSATPVAKLTEAEVDKIRQDKRLQREIAADYGIAQTTVSAIKRKVNWKHLQ